MVDLTILFHNNQVGDDSFIPMKMATHSQQTNKQAKQKQNNFIFLEGFFTRLHFLGISLWHRVCCHGDGILDALSIFINLKERSFRTPSMYKVSNFSLQF